MKSSSGKIGKRKTSVKKKTKSKRNDNVSIHGEKMGRPRKYETLEEAKKASQKQQREYKRRVRAKKKKEEEERKKMNENKEQKVELVRVWGDIEEGKGERKEMNLLDEVKGHVENREEGRELSVEKSGEEKDEEGEKVGKGKVIINVDDETNRRKEAEITDVEEVVEGEVLFQDIEEFGMLHYIQYDGHCGYNSVIAALKHIGKKCRESGKEFRRDIRSFVENHPKRFMGATKDVLDDIFLEKYKYTGRTNRWYDGGTVSPAVAALFGVCVYEYIKGKHDDDLKRTVVYRPMGDNSEKLGWVPVLNRDKGKEEHIIRLYNTAGYHYQWVTLKNTETVDVAETEDVGEEVEVLVGGNDGDTESEKSDVGNKEGGWSRYN